MSQKNYYYQNLSPTFPNYAEIRNTNNYTNKLDHKFIYGQHQQIKYQENIPTNSNAKNVFTRGINHQQFSKPIPNNKPQNKKQSGYICSKEAWIVLALILLLVLILSLLFGLEVIGGSRPNFDAQKASIENKKVVIYNQQNYPNQFNEPSKSDSNSNKINGENKISSKVNENSDSVQGITEPTKIPSIPPSPAQLYSGDAAYDVANNYVMATKII